MLTKEKLLLRAFWVAGMIVFLGWMFPAKAEFRWQSWSDDPYSSSRSSGYYWSDPNTGRMITKWDHRSKWGPGWNPRRQYRSYYRQW